MVVVLNKVDLVPPEKKATHMEKLKKGKSYPLTKYNIHKGLLKVLESTKFANSPMVEISASPNAGSIFSIIHL